MESTAATEPVRFETEPSRYAHWKLAIDGPVAKLAMDVNEDAPLRPGYVLKLNSYDLAVDIELADVVQRLRFEHPEVKAVVVTGAQPKVFCAGANIYMLASSTHSFKVNFCKFTNETRLAIEDASAASGQTWVAALNGTASGGGYELALACESIVLCDDGSSAVSFPETPLLGVLPGTGGLTRLVDKRKVRRDLADVFSTLAEGVRGKRAEQWNLVDKSAPKSKFEAVVAEVAKAHAAKAPEKTGPGVKLAPLEPKRSRDGAKHVSTYSSVTLVVDAAQRTATLEVRAPGEPDKAPASGEALRGSSSASWHLRAFRELDDALLDLRFNHPTVGLVLVETRGDAARVLEHDAALLALEASGDWLAREIRLHVKRVLKRMDMTARSFFAVVDPSSCFAGSLFELALVADRSYMYAGESERAVDEGASARVALGPMNAGLLETATGLTRLATRFLGAPDRAAELAEAAKETRAYDAEEALEAGLVTFAPDSIDWDDELRLAVEERSSLSPDALTGMEQNLRFCGPETLETKIFARLSAWQNWIFIRPNAVGERGALSLYGRPERAEFDWRRT